MFNEMVEFLKGFTEESVDPEFREIIKSRRVFPMTGAGIMSILNGTCKLIDSDKCYLEIGTHRGSTLVGAAHKNVDTKFYGVDNFLGHNSQIEVAPFKTVEEGLVDAINKVGHKNVGYFKEDYESFFATKKDLFGQKAEVYLYDGDHKEVNQYKGLKLATEILADKAIVFVDDTANNDKGAVWNAVNRILKEDSRFSFLAEWLPGEDLGVDRSHASEHRGIGPGLHGDFWCGFMALTFER